MIINFTVNNKKIKLEIDPTKRLIDLLRDDLNLTGVKEKLVWIPVNSGSKI